MVGSRPTAEFATVELETATVAADQRFGRLYLSRYTDPLGFGKTPSRFSDPRRRIERNRFAVLYLGESLKVCFWRQCFAINETERSAIFSSRSMSCGPDDMRRLRSHVSSPSWTSAAMPQSVWACQATLCVARSKASPAGGPSPSMNLLKSPMASSIHRG